MSGAIRTVASREGRRVGNCANPTQNSGREGFPTTCRRNGRTSGQGWMSPRRIQPRDEGDSITRHGSAAHSQVKQTYALTLLFTTQSAPMLRSMSNICGLLVNKFRIVRLRYCVIKCDMYAYDHSRGHPNGKLICVGTYTCIIILFA